MCKTHFNLICTPSDNNAKDAIDDIYSVEYLSILDTPDIYLECYNGKELFIKDIIN